jgi:hypothetical protein
VSNQLYDLYNKVNVVIRNVDGIIGLSADVIDDHLQDIFTYPELRSISVHNDIVEWLDNDIVNKMNNVSLHAIDTELCSLSALLASFQTVTI